MCGGVLNRDLTFGAFTARQNTVVYFDFILENLNFDYIPQKINKIFRN